MNKFIRNNQKKLLAVFSAGLMVIFIIQLAPNQGQQSDVGTFVAGTLNGTNVTQSQINYYTQEWQLLRSLRFVEPDRPDLEPRPLAVGLLGQQLAEDIARSQAGNSTTPLLYLLVQDAARQGVVVSNEQVQTCVTNNVQPLPEVGSEDRERVEFAVRDCLMIRALANRADSVIKITRPYLQMVMAQDRQALSVKFSPIPASLYLDKTPAPTDAQIKKQFDSYSDRIAAHAGAGPGEFGQTADPLGFGYKVPNRVKVQFIGLNFADLRAVAIASKHEEEWDVQAVKEFKDNREEYDTRPVPGLATTQPARVLGPSTEPESSSPSESGVRRIDDFTQDFLLHLPLVRDELYDRQTLSLRDSILRQINEKMSSGYGSYRDLLASGSGKTPNGLAAQYISDKFMQDLAASLRSQFGVSPILGNIEQVKTGDQLAQIEGIGQSVCAIAGSNRQLGFADYAVNLFQPWLSDLVKNSQAGALAIALWQPSNPLEDVKHNFYVFRISGSEDAHTPPLADVKDQVVSDWKLSSAYAMALKAGQALFDSAKRQGLDRAAPEADLAPPILTEAFIPQQVILGYTPVISPLDQPPVNLKPDSMRQLAEISRELLTTAPSASGKPELLAELYADRMVAVIELQEKKPMWQTDTRHILAMTTAEILARDLRAPLEATLFTADAVAARMKYEPTSRPSQ